MFAFFVLLTAISASISNAIVIPLNSGKGGITIEVASKVSFRLSINLVNPTASPAIASPSIDSKNLVPAASKECSSGNLTGLCTSFGSLLASEDGKWALYDQNGAAVVSSSSAPQSSANGVTVHLDQSFPSLPGQPCLSNGMFGPTFGTTDNLFVFAVSEHAYDSTPPLPVAVHCYGNTFQGREPRHTRGDLCKQSDIKIGVDGTNFKRSNRYPNGTIVKNVSECCSLCNGDTSCTSWIATQDLKPDESGSNCWIGFCVDGVGEPTLKCKTKSATNRLLAHIEPPTPSSSDWWILGHQADWYLAPILTKLKQYAALYELTGAPKLPPRYGFGFMATYWGYNNMRQVIGNMTKFRDGKYPIDSFIMDYDWWKCGTSPGDECNPDLVTGQDFQYDSAMFGKNVFENEGWPTVQTKNATDLLQYMHAGIGNDKNEHTLRMRFSGIRKPRSYSHYNTSQKNGWLLPDSDTVGAGLNNWNFTIDEFLAFYAKGNEHFVSDGIDFWWNDEGETQWYTYYYWNLAQRFEVDKVDSNRRMFTLNRAFTSGMQKFPSVTWTGDMQDCSHSKALQFAKWGQPWFTCDLTSPTATVLLRQYQGAVWWPIMRVHQMHNTPRFPWYWGTDLHHDAFRSALNTRYAVLPFLYSLAHRQHLPPHSPMVHPASWSYPGHQNLNETYMVGDSVIAADLSTSNSFDPNENSSSVVLPDGTIWFLFNSTETVLGTGNPIVRNRDLQLNEFPVYVSRGSIIPIHPWDRAVQHSQAQGGVLEVQVYGGGDASFEMYEDDGTSNDYTNSGNFRVTSFLWNDGTGTLKWKVDGGKKSYNGGNDYTDIRIALYDAGSKDAIRSKTVKIGRKGEVNMGTRKVEAST